jgi:hypothetical protein
MPRPRRALLCALAISSLLASYVAAYFAILALPGSVHFGPGQPIQTKLLIINGERIADFHGLPPSLFAPLSRLDTAFLRPRYWRPWPRNAEMDFTWLNPGAFAAPR